MLVHVNSHERRITIEGDLHIHDDDSGDPDCPSMIVTRTEISAWPDSDVDDGNPSVQVTLGAWTRASTVRSTAN
jgi:hypothetical protein